MDNHPIPQDVTGFQFRLIGDMTLKQFAYLAGGAIFAWICLSLPLFFLIKFPLVFFFAGLGALLAFIPIGGRPADIMLLFFLKALFSPSQYLYKQAGGSIAPSPSPQKTFVKQDDKKEEKKDEKKDEKVHFDAYPAQIAQTVLQPTPPALPERKEESPAPLTQLLTPLPSATPEQKQGGEEPALTQEVEQVSSALEAAKQEEKQNQGTAQAAAAHEKVTQLEDELQTILKQKQDLEQKLLELEKQLSEKKQQVFTPTEVKEEPQQSSHVRQVPTTMGTVVGAPLVSDVPNLISGVVKDPRGNVLPNILIEVKDKDNNPVRAFKTNQLGQFASATPILNGVYTITFEDPQDKQKFDAIELTAKGDILNPLEVISTDAREALRKELFGT